MTPSTWLALSLADPGLFNNISCFHLWGKQCFEAHVLAVAVVSGAGFLLSAAGAGPLVVLGWQPHVRAMTQCLAEAGRAGSSPQPAAEQAWLCAGQLKRSFMTPLITA